MTGCGVVMHCLFAFLVPVLIIGELTKIPKNELQRYGPLYLHESLFTESLSVISYFIVAWKLGNFVGLKQALIAGSALESLGMMLEYAATKFKLDTLYGVSLPLIQLGLQAATIS
ncbi:hypothetical protein QG37_07703 [Candidozyma auris]|nr:hypothetical protein QG37_07703 [[Candida] auris]